jgi:hypothetical protein
MTDRSGDRRSPFGVVRLRIKSRGRSAFAYVGGLEASVRSHSFALECDVMFSFAGYRAEPIVATGKR